MKTTAAKKHGERLLFAKHLCAIVLLTALGVESSQAQTRKIMTRSPVASEFVSMPGDKTRTDIKRDLLKEFDNAWQISGDGTNGREGVVLIFRMYDGSYAGKSQGLCNEYRKSTFTWNPAAIAIVHTHPNDSDPRPSANDRQVAERYQVRIFTITLSGMYGYDPATKRTSKVVNGLAWLDLSSYPEGPKRWFAA